MVASTIFKTAAQIAARMAGKSSVGKSPAGLRSLLKTSEDIPVSVLEHPMSMEIIQHPALVKSYDRWLKMKGRPKEYGEEELRLINEEELRLDDLESPFSPVGLTREERGYFTNLPRSGSGISEKKLSPTEVEFFEDMIREGDPYDFMRDVPSAKIRTDKKGNKYLRVQGEMEDLFRFIVDTDWGTGDLPSTMRRGDWYNKFKEISEFKHGGGISGIGEKIIYREDGGPVIKRFGGGLSNLKKSININGQPHDLAWIRPDEASALRAMGGSGKKVKGIPAYFNGAGDTGWSGDLGAYGDDSDMTGDPQAGVGWDSDENVYVTDTTTPADTKERIVSPAGMSWADQIAGGYERPVTGLPWLDKGSREDWLDQESDTGLRTGFLHKFGDLMTNRQVLAGAHKVGYDNWRATVGQYSRDPGKDYDEWFAGQNKDALISGYEIGDPFGMAMKFKMNVVNEQLQDKFKKEKEKLKDDDSEVEREDLQEAAKDIKEIKGFAPYDGIPWHPALPGGTITGLMNLASSTVIGVGTVNGIRVHVHENGSVSAISPEDSPGFVSGEDTGNIVGREKHEGDPHLIRKPKEEVVPDTGPMEKYQQGLSTSVDTTGIENSIQIIMDQFNVTPEVARQMLGLPSNTGLTNINIS